MLIRFLSLLSLLPLFYIYSKVKKRRDLSCLDILVLFYTLFMGLIPLFDDLDDLMAEVKQNDAVQIYVFFVNNVFVWGLVLIDRYILSRKKNSLWNMTSFIRNWASHHILSDKILLFLFILVVFQWIIGNIAVQEMTAIGVSGTGIELREAKAEYNTPFMMFLSLGTQVLRMYVIFTMTIFFIQSKAKYGRLKHKWAFIFLVILEFLLFMQGARLDLIESVLLLFIILYSLKKNEISNKNIAKYVSLTLLVAIMVFPLITGLRFARKAVIASSQTDLNVLEVLGMGFDMLLNGDVDLEDVDNKGSRAWDFYQSMCLASSSDYEGTGFLTTIAVLHAVPKAILPDKPEGSQTVVEKATGRNVDMTDSLLLLGVMESRLLAPFWGLLLYMIVFSSFSFMYKFLYGILPQSMCVPFVVGQFFWWTNHVEVSFDSWLSSVITLIMWYFVFYFMIIIMKLFKIRLLEYSHVVRGKQLIFEK